MHLHFTGRTWRPHYEADSVIIQATSGCTYNQCRLVSANARRVFWTGANLFANSVSNFYPVTAYLPKERSSVLGALQHVIDTVSEEEMTKYRRSLKALG